MAQHDLTLKQFGRLIALERTGTRQGYALWACLCECGNLTEVISNSLIRGLSKSCGCLLKETASEKAKTHGAYKTPTYVSYRAMRDRCLNKNNPNYKKYGALGVTICTRWLESFDNFLADMGERPEGTTLDRRKSAGNYTPENCRWSTVLTQGRNKRKTVMTLELAATIRELRKSTGWGPAQLAAHFNVPATTINGIIYGGNWAA